MVSCSLANRAARHSTFVQDSDEIRLVKKRFQFENCEILLNNSYKPHSSRIPTSQANFYRNLCKNEQSGCEQSYQVIIWQLTQKDLVTEINE